MKDFIPIQPYFVLNTDEFRQYIYLKDGISHFYGYEVIKGNDFIYAVPDGCLDIIFENSPDSVNVYACGTAMKYTETFISEGKNYFGVRFMPGVCLDAVGVPMKELVNNQIQLETIPVFSGLARQIHEEVQFKKRVELFIESYEKQMLYKENVTKSRRLAEIVRKMIYESSGMVKISELEEKTGYSARYINKVFTRELGYSPKNLCQIIRFQACIGQMLEKEPGSLTDIAQRYGYYDQAQFIRGFKEYCGMTPKEYVHLLQQQRYAERIVETGRRQQ